MFTKISTNTNSWLLKTFIELPYVEQLRFYRFCFLEGFTTAYMAAKIRIEEYLMEKFLKVYYQLEDKMLRWQVMPNKSALIDWTYRTYWNSGEEPQKVIC